MQKSLQPLDKEFEKELTDSLALLISDLKKPDKILDFLTLFLSETELLVLAKRVAIFKRLHEAQSYESIQKQLTVSSATISSVAQLKNHPFSDTVLAHITANDWAERTADKLRKLFVSHKAAM